MKESLNFGWKFTPDFEPDYLLNGLKNFENVDIPHTMKEVPYNYFNELDYQMVGSYEKTFDVGQNIKGKVVTLRFEAFMLRAKIYLNGELLGYFHSGYVPVEIDITKHVKQENNRLFVILDSHEYNEIPPFGFVIDYLTFSGIYREVSINVHPKTYIKDIYVNAEMDGKIKVTYTKVGNNPIDAKHEILDKNNKVVMSFNDDSIMENPHLWSLDDPYLYTLRTTINGIDGKETYLTRFGFRSIRWEKNGFYLNNKKIKLRGLNRHQSYPVMGYAASKALQEDDANTLKYVCGVNVVRTSHYPNSQHFLNRCDEIGLLVINEIPGWQHMGTSEEWINNYYEFVEKMVIEERGHPSLIAHGVRIDESQDNHDMYLKGNKIAHNLDPYRPTIGVRNFENSELLEDIYGYNDFMSWKVGSKPLHNPKEVKGKKDKPYLITEYLGHMDPTKATSDREQKTEHTIRHLEVINEALKYDRISGAIGWCFADYHTHIDFGSGDRICPHGVMDLYRNPKPAHAAYAIMQDEFPVLEVLSNMKPGDVPGAKFGEIILLTNADYVELYQNNKFVKRFYPKKDKKFKYLKHPPILVDDIVGDIFHEDRFSKKDGVKIAKLLSFAGMNGLNALSAAQKVTLASLMVKYKVTYDELVAYWQKYVGTWGGEAKEFKFVAIKDNQEVKKVILGPSRYYKLETTLSKLALKNEETYDTLRIALRFLDNNGALMEYANKPVKISVSGPIRLVGEKIQSLLGGQLSIYINSLHEEGIGKIKIQVDDLVKTIEIQVNN